MIRPCSFVSAVWLSALSGSAWGGSLTVRVEPHKAVIVLGEPVLITTTVTNEGSEPMKLSHHNVPTIDQHSLSVVDLMFGADEENLEHWSDYLRPLGKTGPRTLAPDESLSFDLVMLYNRKDGFFATTPGKYWIQGRVVIAPSPYVEILTTPIAIEVREPPRAERAVWQWLSANKDEYGRLVQVPWEAKLSEEFVQECNRICTETTSSYGEYLALFLSRWYCEGPNKDAAKSQRFAEIAKVKATSEKVRTEADKLLSGKQPTP
ncbi:MAG: hypothetical protein AABZ47_01890 [Planctomycetota bacterium]